MISCPGCFGNSREGTFCRSCLRRLFDGKKVPFQLPFNRPDFDREKLQISPDRMSISGIQPKITLALKSGRLEMVKSGGEYILKPRPHGIFAHLEWAPINEHLTMQIARQVFGIQVAENALVAFPDGELAYLVRRFDIQPDGTRSLQEDFAQVARKSEETDGKNYKYDFSYEEIGDLIRTFVPTFKVDLERYFELLVFNYLVNNGDAHMKNFSLLRSEETGQYHLSPAYDLLDTRIHLPGESQTALELFKDGFETPSYTANAFYAYDDFVEFARKMGLVESRTKRILEKFIDSQSAVHSLVEGSALPGECKVLYRTHVEERIRALSYSFCGQRG